MKLELELEYIKLNEGEAFVKKFKAEGSYGKLEVAMVHRDEGYPHLYQTRRWFNANDRDDELAKAIEYAWQTFEGSYDDMKFEVQAWSCVAGEV